VFEVFFECMYVVYLCMYVCAAQQLAIIIMRRDI
jgi:hypothetical protein